ncbi:hypothetical protein HW090_08175 [Pseudomonas sp. ABC1]|uniref:hypothetical protein n=1 Tax=Pseudomonas sp. ABC1 TaxID=2748080 RepID=UPI0015C2CD67|nr:hypothetical protein [Pseudomonas sp. ABC1]QLF93168.1 hypothetical protein HW090_08175 [Pseudomonas sp. ABC1]
MSTEADCKAVPERYRGVWQRTLLRTADGLEDRTTPVFWVQTDVLHGDLRIPQAPAPDWRSRSDIVAFAGITRVVGERCQWHRLLDYQPPGPADIGTMRFVDDDEVHETALDGSYLEIWQRLPDSRGGHQALWLVAEGRQACLLRAGDWFLFAAERSGVLAGGGPLSEQLARLDEAGRDALLDCEFSFGRIQGGGSPWSILLSSLPGRVGQVLLEGCGEDLPSIGGARLAGLGAQPPVSGWTLAPLPSLALEAGV